jgi:flagellar biosynthesis protein
MDDKLKKALALKYRRQVDHAPKVVAKGRGIIAERIIEIAKEHHIPLKRDPALIEVLSKMDLDQEIPSELYRAVAEVLAYVYKMSGKLNSID